MPKARKSRKSPFMTFIFDLDLDSLRPENPKLCSDKQFKIFCKAFRHVMKTRKDNIPLHALIRSHVQPFIEGKTTFEDMCEELTRDTMVAHLFTDNRLRSGKLTHKWKPEDQGSHFWLEDFIFHCHAMSNDESNDDVFDHTQLEGLVPRNQLKVMEQWAYSVMEKGATWCQSMGYALPRVEVLHGVHPTRLILRVIHPVPEDALFQLTIHDDLTIELSWDTNTGNPLLDFGIHNRIVESYVHDDSINDADESKAPVYTLKIEHADSTSVAA